MGYTTDFEGEVGLSKPLTLPQFNYLKAFNETRRMKRDASKTEGQPDPKRKAVGLPVGPEGAYFVGGSGFHGQGRDEDVLDYNHAPEGQPGLWCQWTPNEDGTCIQWDGGEKFYDYVKWMAYIIENFLEPWGIVANGNIRWVGEDSSDRGVIIVKDNVVTTKEFTDPTDEELDEAPTYTKAEVIACLKKIVSDAKDALKRVESGKGDPKQFLDSLHSEINDLYHSVDEGQAELE